MRTEQLYYLCKTVDAGSINAAAEKLHLSQQGLNASMKSLEKEIGYTLFTTSREGIALTPQGELVVEAAKKVIDVLEELTITLKQTTTTAVSEFITIYAAPVVYEYVMPEIFRALSNKYVHLGIKIIEREPMQIIEAVKKNECDLAVVGIQYNLMTKLGRLDIFSDNLIFKELYSYRFSLAVSEHHPLAQYRSVSIKTAIQYPIALFSSGPIEEDLNYQWLQNYGHPKIKFVTASRDIYFNILRDGSAIGFFPNTRHGHFNISAEDGIKRIPLKNDEAIHKVGYLLNKDKEITPAIQLVMNELEAFCK